MCTAFDKVRHEVAEASDSVGYWSKQRAAAYLDVAPHTIDYLVRTDRLPFYRIAGKRRFAKADLDAYADSNRVGGSVSKDVESVG